jgi:signal peptidase II
LKPTRPSYLLLGGIGAGVIILDQITKALVRANLPLNTMWAPWDWLLPIVRLYHTENTGVAFGMLQGAGWIFSILAIFVAAAIIYYYPRVPVEDWTLRIALGLQLGGALGNVVDRIFFNGYVTDFISVGTFAIFNVADMSITCGVGVLLLGVWLQDRKKTNEPQIPPEQNVNENEPAEKVQE